MSSRARVLTDPRALARFEWHAGTPSPAPAAPGLRLVETAPAELEDAVPAHRTSPDAIERDAFTKGYAQGERAGNEAAAKRGEAMLRRLTQTLEELTELRAQMIHHTEHQMVQLALAVARRIAHREVSLDQDLLIAMARVALDRLSDSASVTVRLNPDDHQATITAAQRAWTGTNVTVVGDARVARGGCRIESDFGTLDAGIDAQIHELGRALLGEGVPSADMEAGVEVGVVA